MAKSPPAADAIRIHPWAEVRNSHPKDIKLREAGFEIHRRPRRGPVTWRHKKTGKIMVEAEALIYKPEEQQK